MFKHYVSLFCFVLFIYIILGCIVPFYVRLYT